MNIVVTGGTSGIGRALAELCVSKGHKTGVTGRRGELLEEIRAASGGKIETAEMDVTDCGRAQLQLLELVKRMGGAGRLNPRLDWDEERKVIETNTLGFAATALAAYKYFADRGGGHLAGISSIAGLRGSSRAPAYSASKAFVSNYLEGLRFHAAYLGLPITVTDVRPGFVRTAMTKPLKNVFWMSEPDEAARQIYAALLKKKKCVYVTRRWRLAACLLQNLPDFIYERF